MTEAELLLFLDIFLVNYKSVYKSSNLLLFKDICYENFPNSTSDKDFIQNLKFSLLYCDKDIHKIGYHFIKLLTKRLTILSK